MTCLEGSHVDVSDTMLDHTLPVELRVEALLAQMTLEEKIAQIDHVVEPCEFIFAVGDLSAACNLRAR